MTSAIVAVLVFGLVVAVIVLFARDRGPQPADLAVAYEWAWDRLDFDALWTLSGPELRDGLDKHRYVAAKSEAYAGRGELGHLVAAVEVEAAQVGIAHAVVRTRVVLRTGAVVHNDVQCTKHSSAWAVSGYQLVAGPPQPV